MISFNSVGVDFCLPQTKQNKLSLAMFLTSKKNAFLYCKHFRYTIYRHAFHKYSDCVFLYLTLLQPFMVCIIVGAYGIYGHRLQVLWTFEFKSLVDTYVLSSLHRCILLPGRTVYELFKNNFLIRRLTYSYHIQISHPQYFTMRIDLLLPLQSS